MTMQLITISGTVHGHPAGVPHEPGAVVRGTIRELIRTWPNLTETTVTGSHFVQEDSPDEIGTAVADFVRRLTTT